MTIPGRLFPARVKHPSRGILEVLDYDSRTQQFTGLDKKDRRVSFRREHVIPLPGKKVRLP